LNILQLRYANIDHINTFKIYVVSDSLKKYTTSLKDRKYGITKLPHKSCRAKDKEIAGSEELKEESDKSESETEECPDNVTEALDESDHTNNFQEGDMELENSRTSIKDLHQDALNTAYEFDPDDLVRRESIMIFSSVITPKPLTLEDFEILSVLGKGTFGKVYLTKQKSTEKLYAIKSMRKDVLIETDQIEATKLERDILLK